MTRMRIKAAGRFQAYAFACLVALPIASAAVAQEQALKPFDMTPEGGSTALPVTPAPTPTPAPAIPLPVTPTAAPATTQELRTWLRYVVPSDALALVGEHYQRSWNIALTAQEANAPARLNVGYQSAILVAPESSYFSISLNNVEILQHQVQSTGQLSEIVADIPKGVLKEGANTIIIRAQQRHRTDCSIASTYELWTNIDPQKTFLSFDLPLATQGAAQGVGQSTKRFIGSEDIAAIGVDAKGRTQFNLIAPGLGKGEHGVSLLNLSQALAILSDMPNQSFSVERFLDPALIHKDGARSGQLTVLIGTQSELSSALENFQIAPDESTSSPIRFVSNAQTAEQFLVITGESWREIDHNIDRLVSMTALPANTMRSVIQTQNWNLPDARLIRDATSLTFGELGIANQQFSGRRLLNQFTFGLASDFYANAYGAATILLDAAYSAEVQPGSHIDVYVNGNIATTIPISSGGGGVMHQLPIKIEMRHFRPGLNTISIEAALMTEADNVCATGTPSSKTPRFALFDTSTFKMPSFARIGQIPNLAATAGMAFPYTYANDDVWLASNLSDYNVLSAAATVVGNLATAAGRPLKIRQAQPDDAPSNSNTLFIGAVSNLPDNVLAQAGINPQAKTIWSNDDAAAVAAPKEANYTLSQWQESLQSGWQGRLESFYASLRDTFDLSREGLRLFPGSKTLFIPSKSVSVVAAQGSSPSKTGTWTVVTAPDNVLLRHGVENLAQQTNWTKLGGQITAYNHEKQAVEIIPTQSRQFLVTQPLSFTNLRLIATNWLSSNTLSYVIIVLVSLIALGLTTSSLLLRSGRRDDEE